MFCLTDIFDLLALKHGGTLQVKSLWRFGKEDKSCKAGEVWFKIKLLASFWAISSNLFGSLSVSDLCGNWNAAIQ
ncbi:hypothetical protein LguiB_001383 [Lonicera macranthoides]